MTMRVAIIGGGIAGLAAAIAAIRAGAEATVFEQAPALSPIGTSLTIWPNAMAALDELGVGGTVAETGRLLQRLTARRPDGRALMDIDLTPIYAAVGQRGFCISRAALMRLLLDALPDGVLALGHRLQSATDDGWGVALKFHNGYDDRADLVIAADGLRSPLRAQLFGAAEPRYSGYGAWLGQCAEQPAGPGQDGQTEACEYMGANGRFGIIPTDDGCDYWYFVARRAKPESGVFPGNRAALEAELSHWPEFARAHADQTPNRAMPYVSFFDRPGLGSFGRGNIVLAGDAAHPFLPNLGQGACQAIEDARALGQAIGAGLTGETLIRHYDSARRDRANRIGRESRQSGQMMQMQSPLGRLARRAFFAALPQSALNRQLLANLTLPRLPALPPGLEFPAGPQ